MTKLIAYCAGHGKYTAGKRSPSGIFEEREWFFNDEVVRAFEKELKNYDVKLLRTDDRTGKTDVLLRDRTNAANRAKADLYISFHHNAYQNKWGNHTGVETFYYAGSNEGKKLATEVQKAIVKTYGLRDRGIKTDNLHITRETKMTAILIEGGFMDSNIDIKKLRDKKVLQETGKEVAKVVASYLGLKKKEKANDTTSTPVKKDTAKKENVNSSSPKTKSGSKWTVVTGNWNGNTVLKKGHTGVPVRQLQKMLHDKEYLTAKQIDGYFGDITEQAVKKAQKDGKITVDGLAGKQTYNTLQANKKTVKYPLPTNTLRRGSKGAAVRNLQLALNAAGFNAGNPDGIFGRKTEDAVKRFQKVYDPKNVDGIYGSRTRERLNNVVNK